MSGILVEDAVKSLPDGTIVRFREDNMESVTVHSLAANKKVVLFGVSGAFNPTCSMQHVPNIIERAEELISKGVEEILLLGVNDPFVMKAWSKTFPDNKHIKFLSDGSGKYTRALGYEHDLSEKGLGIRSRSTWHGERSMFMARVDSLQRTVSCLGEPRKSKLWINLPNHMSSVLSGHELNMIRARHDIQFC